MAKEYTMINNLQFYLSESLNPYINLATEKILFDSVDSQTLILYLWQNENTVVIGKNQNAYSECRTELLKEEGVTLARRLSGGGAVFHDIGNLNFTFICTSDNLDIAKHIEVIRTALSSVGIDTELSGRNDILADGKKFSGNAFYNSRGHSYHHGTILINADTEKLGRYLTPPIAKLEAKGVKSVRSRVINLCELCPDLTCDNMKTLLLSAFEKTYGIYPIQIASLDEAEISVLAEQYAAWEYIYGAPLSFDTVCCGRLSIGNTEIQMQVKGGKITALKFYTDSLDTELPEKAERALASVPFAKEAIYAALSGAISDDEAKEITSLIEKQILT